MTIKLNAKLRADKEKLDSDFMPGVVYGKDVENRNLKMKRADFEKTFKEAGESNLIDLNVDDSSVKVLVKEIQRDVLKNFYTHVDFYQVNMKEKVKAEIPFHFIGEAKAVKELGGALIKDMSSIEVECLPTDLVDHIDVDISVLNTFEDSIRVDDLKLPAGLVLVQQTNEVIAAVKEPKVEEEPTPVAAPVAEAGKGGTPEAKAGDAKKEETKK